MANNSIAEPQSRLAAIRPKNRQTLPQGGENNIGPVPGLLTRRISSWLGGLGNFSPELTAAQIESPISMNPLLWSYGATGLSPLRVLTFLSEISPPIAYSCDMNLRLGVPAGGLTIVGGKINTDGTGFEHDDAATAILDALWENLPDEIGGLHGLQTSLMLTAMFTGLSCIEAVPAKGLDNGVARVWPVDPLTIEFARPNINEDTKVYQKQPKYLPSIIGKLSSTSTAYSELAEINTNTFFWRALDNWPDSPYGTPLYSTALPEVLLQISILKDLKESIHANAWPRKAYGFNFENANKIAVELYHMTQEQAKTYVAQEFDNLRKQIASTMPDDDVIYDSEGDVKTLEAGNYASLPAVLDYLRANLFWSMKELPSLMGVDASNADSYNTISWLIKAQRLESLRDIVMHPCLRTANLHFRLLGLPFIAKANYPKLRGADELIDAQTEDQKFRTARDMRDEGAISQNEFAVRVSGSKAEREVPLSWERQKIKGSSSENQAPKPTGNNIGQGTDEQNATRRANKNRGK